MLEEFAPSLYLADGPSVPFLSIPYPTRMALVPLTDGSLWVWSPIALTDDLAREVNDLGVVRHIVSPNKLHHLYLQQWQQRWPEASVYAPPGLAKKKPDIRFDAQLDDEPDPAWAEAIDQTIFRGSLFMEEVVFFHRASKTAIFCDLIQRHHEADLSGFKRWVMRLDGLTGENGSTPREWRASFLNRAPARHAREQVFGWQAQRLLIAHGACLRAGAEPVIRSALSWI